MSDARLKLLGSSRNTQLDTKALDECLLGARGLREAVGVSDSEIGALRRQSRAHYEVGRPLESLAVLRGLFALGSMELEDTVLVALCLEAQGDREGASLWMNSAEHWAANAADLLGRKGSTS